MRTPRDKNMIDLIDLVVQVEEQGTKSQCAVEKLIHGANCKRCVWCKDYFSFHSDMIIKCKHYQEWKGNLAWMK